MYNWRPATGDDVQNIVNMAETHFQQEIDGIFQPEPVVYSRNVTLAIVTQFYNPLSQLFSVCYQDGKLLAYTWACRGETAPWSDNEMIVVRMAHVDLTLSNRLRIQLVQDMLELWEGWAYLCQVPVLCSTTMRGDQRVFLRLHERAGFTVRGSYAYKRINLRLQPTATDVLRWQEHDLGHNY